MHAEKTPPSSEHWKVEPDSLAVNVHVALVLVTVPLGPELMVVWGAVRSIVQLWLAGVASVLLAASVARTRNWCVPTARPAYERGDVHAVKVAPSSEHWNVEPDSLAEKANVALVEFVLALGPDVIVVSGGVVSAASWIVQLRLAGVVSALPAASVAKTRNVCDPVLRPVY